MNHFEMLGVSRQATAEECKRAYFSLAKDHHPDRHGGQPDTRALADQIYGLLSNAYAVLSDPRSRDPYVRSLHHRARSAAAEAVSRVLTADGLVQRAEHLLKRRRWQPAWECLRQAVQLCPEEAELHALLGWSLFMTQPADPEVTRQAEAHLEKALSMNPDEDRAHVLMGRLYKSTGRTDLAEREFEKAVRCNPDCAEARQELRARSGLPPPLAPRLKSP